jgi:hypothetical protein
VPVHDFDISYIAQRVMPKGNGVLGTVDAQIMHGFVLLDTAVAHVCLYMTLLIPTLYKRVMPIGNGVLGIVD